MIFPISYFPNIFILGNAVQQGLLTLQENENYQKRTFRNSCLIVSANGVESLSVPLKSGKNNQSPIRNVKISNDEPWRKQHLGTIKAAYGQSAYFDHYYDVVEELINNEEESLFDYNLKIILTLAQVLHLPFEICFSSTFDRESVKLTAPFISKGEMLSLSVQSHYYPQVFEYKHGFVSGLSILDAMFCLGPAAAGYLLTVGKSLNKIL